MYSHINSCFCSKYDWFIYDQYSHQLMFCSIHVWSILTTHVNVFTSINLCFMYDSNFIWSNISTLSIYISVCDAWEYYVWLTWMILSPNGFVVTQNHVQEMVQMQPKPWKREEACLQSQTIPRSRPWLHTGLYRTAKTLRNWTPSWKMENLNRSLIPRGTSNFHKLRRPSST